MIKKSRRTSTKAASLAMALMLTQALNPSFSRDDDNMYTFGIVPQQSASRLAEIWIPILEAWGEAAGLELTFATAKDIPTFEACLSVGAYDFSYMNPYHYTVFHELSGYEAFAHQKDKELRGLIVTRRDSGISDLKELDQSRVAFPSPAAFGASVIPRAEMKAMGVDFEALYVKSHDSVYRAVSSGLVQAGGGVLRTFRTIDDDLRSTLKLVYQTEGYTPHAFAAHPGVDDAVVTSLLMAMTDALTAETGLLSSLGMVGIEVASDAEWDDVRALDLTHDQTNIVDGEVFTCHSG